MPMCGSLRKPTSRYTDSWRKELEVILGKYFSGCTLTEGWTDRPYSRCRRRERDSAIAVRVVTPSRVRWTIQKFVPCKATGTDGIFPALLAELPSVTRILRACVAVSYTLRQ